MEYEKRTDPEKDEPEEDDGVGLAAERDIHYGEKEEETDSGDDSDEPPWRDTELSYGSGGNVLYRKVIRESGDKQTAGVVAESGEDRTKQDITGQDARIQISYDRSNVVLRLFLKDGFELYKQAKKEFASGIPGDCLELPQGSVSPGGYTCVIRGKMSLKSLVCGEETVTLKNFDAFLNCVCLLLESGIRKEIEIRDVVFDYNAIFVRNPDSDYRFMYMPGLRYAGNRTSVAELVKVIFLNLNSDLLTATDYNTICALIKTFRQESEAEEIKETVERIRGQIESYLVSVPLRLKLKNVLKFPDKKVKAAPVQKEEKAVAVFSGTDALEGLYSEIEIYRNSPAVFRIGRDDDWSDAKVFDLFASRRHAEVTLDFDGKMRVTNYSVNGTVVNGERLSGEEELVLGDEEAKLYVTRSCGFSVRLKRPAA
ncbi:MAG: FHA domain-containing protein [Clostridia bacterium]|nr:FHA domain-containing protein [Clostridia bacterium]